MLVLVSTVGLLQLGALKQLWLPVPPPPPGAAPRSRFEHGEQVSIDVGPQFLNFWRQDARAWSPTALAALARMRCEPGPAPPSPVGLGDEPCAFPFTSEVQTRLWAWQHPADCTRARFFIARAGSPHTGQGIGSIFHTSAHLLWRAIADGRVLVWDPESWSAFADPAYCAGTQSHAECYFVAPSNCTIAHARARADTEVSDWGLGQYMSTTPVWGFAERLSALADWVEPSHATWWWIAQATAYLARFNGRSAGNVTARLFDFGGLPPGTIHAHVRTEHLKAGDMRLVPAEEFVGRAMRHAGERVVRQNGSWSFCHAGACAEDSSAGPKTTPSSSDIGVDGVGAAATTSNNIGGGVLAKSLFVSTEDPGVVDVVLNPEGPLRSAGWSIFALPVPRAAQGNFRPADALGAWQGRLWGLSGEMLNALQAWLLQAAAGM
jgi:hypothetical protein